MKRTLGIDTSCDETSIAFIDENGKVLSNLISSQVNEHAAHGGVVPELASRAHMEMLNRLFEQCLSESKVTLDDIEQIAVTHTPGLIGCLLVGVNFAKALAYRLRIPLIAVNHLDGHLFSPFIESQITYPFLGLVVSGGHTAFYRVKKADDIEIVGQTVDDAAGEAFDKGAKLLGLGYPGGPVIDRLARQGKSGIFQFGVPKVKMGEQYLSFSGLKTSLAQQLRKHPPKEDQIADYCASLQISIVRILCEKADYFLKNDSYKSLALSGGVAMNSVLRASMDKICSQNGVELNVAKPEFCTDNAVMIAAAATVRGIPVNPFDLNAEASRKIQARSLARQIENKS